MFKIEFVKGDTTGYAMVAESNVQAKIWYLIDHCYIVTTISEA